MARQTITQLKQWFENGDYPTQQQFWDWMDSYMHKDDIIEMGMVNGLISLLQDMNLAIANAGSVAQGPVVLTGMSSYQVPARYLVDKIIVEEASAIEVTIGTVDGGADLAREPMQNILILSNFDYYRTQISTIFFGGITASTLISIYTR